MDKSYQMQVQIVNIKHNKEEKKVYNFAVENDESYTLNGVVSHNCRCRVAPLLEDQDVNPTDEITKADFNVWLNDY